MKKKALDFVKGGIILGTGASILEGIGGTTAGYGATAMGNMAKFMPTMGSVYGAGMVVKAFKKFPRL